MDLRDILPRVDPEKLQNPTVVALVHDLLKGVLTDMLPCPMTEEEREQFDHYAQVLCWILGHTSPGSAGEEFGDRMKELTERVLAANGNPAEKLRERVRRHRAN